MIIQRIKVIQDFVTSRYNKVNRQVKEVKKHQEGSKKDETSVDRGLNTIESHNKLLDLPDLSSEKINPLLIAN